MKTQSIRRASTIRARRPQLVRILPLLLVLFGSPWPPAAAIQPELANYDPSKQIRFRTPEEADARRQTLIRWIWSEGLPTQVLPKVSADVDDDVFDGDLAGIDSTPIATVDRLDASIAPYDFHSIMYLIHPMAENDNRHRLIIVHSGHRKKVTEWPGLDTTVNRLLREGFTVLVMDMPLYGWNRDNTLELPSVTGTVTVNRDPYKKPNPHDDLFAKLTPHVPEGGVYRFFLEPVVQGVNHFLAMDPKASDVSMIGLSGGGWTTHLSAAVDTRIKLSVPVAGSMPLYARAIIPKSNGDAEQIYPPLYRELDTDNDGIAESADGVASYLETFALGAYGERRQQIQILNFKDPCCFSTDAYESYDRFVSGVVRKLGAGRWSVHSDRTHKDHKVSPDVLHQVIMPTLQGQLPSHAEAQPVKASATDPTRIAPTPQPEQTFSDMRVMWDGTPTTQPPALDDADEQHAFKLSECNARQASEVLYRCEQFVDGWLDHADPRSGLIPRNLARDRDFWNAKDAAADNYPFMVLTCALVDRPRYYGRMHEMLRSEIRHTCRIDRLPDTYRFSTGAFASAKPNIDAILFGSSEYVKDGLMPLTEWLGPSPWRERMIGITDDIWKHANVDAACGKIPTSNIEAHGEMLQCLSRIFWMTGDKKYLEWAIRLGDHYLLGDNHPTKNRSRLLLGDHGCEVVSGLCELYVAVHFARPDKAREYQQPIHAMCDRILEAGRRRDGMMYLSFNPQTGEHSRDITDTWGYNYNGIYTVYLLDGTLRYREAVRHVLNQLRDSVSDYDWGNADQYADTIEGAINLLNREPSVSAAQWVDTEIRKEWAKQRADGVIEGWHGDGNSARTGIMYVLWKSKGTHVRPWRNDVRIGGEQRDSVLYLNLMADSDWQGAVYFDRPRHKDYLHLPLDYPRINQFPEWYTVEATVKYVITDVDANAKQTVTGAQLIDGLPLTLQAGEQRRWKVECEPVAYSRQ